MGLFNKKKKYKIEVKSSQFIHTEERLAYNPADAIEKYLHQYKIYTTILSNLSISVTEVEEEDWDQDFDLIDPF